MKIGFSFGRCIGDIVRGKVDIDDVLVIISRTLINQREQIPSVVTYYMWEPNYLLGLDHAECLRIAEALYDSGKVHQPRQFRVPTYRVPDGEVWMDLAPTADTDNESVKQAWNNYQMMLRLTADKKPQIPSHIRAKDNF